MPEHVHLLFAVNLSTTADPPPLYRILGDIKSISAHKINKTLRRKGTVWQQESFDYVLRRNEFDCYMEYIAQNAVKRGLVKKPAEYPWYWKDAEDIVTGRVRGAAAT